MKEIDYIIEKSRNNDLLTKKELVEILSYPSASTESFLMMAEANRISRMLTGNRSEIHAQFALNLAPCGCNCLFCSFAAVNNIFNEKMELTVEEAVHHSVNFEQAGANAIFVMATASYPFGKFIEYSKEIREKLNPETVLIANVGDATPEEARKLKDTGFQGVYHALRLREGIDTTLDPEKRKQSIRNFKEAGLGVGTCVEPVGPEHTNEELAEMILFTASINPSYSGAARRITIPGGQLEDKGMISELRMAQIVAATRLAMPRTTIGNCTHEPCTLGAMAGANLFWAEVGANPRDTKEKTEEGRGGTIPECRRIFLEADCEILEGASAFY